MEITDDMVKSAGKSQIFEQHGVNVEGVYDTLSREGGAPEFLAELAAEGGSPFARRR